MSCQVIVVSHNSEATLSECVACVLAQRKVQLTLSVVDNASQVDPATYLPPDDPRLQIQRLESNFGFAHACNIATEGNDANWLWFLNPDCLPQSNTLSELLAVANRYPEVGLWGVRLLNPDGTPQAASLRRTPTPWNLLTGRVNVEPQVATPGGSAEAVERADAISGAAMLIRRDLFEQLRGFDSLYRLHCEDLDLCRRVVGLGKQVALASGIEMVHIKGTSSRDKPVWVEWQKHRGMWRYFNKFDRDSTPAWLSALLMVGLIARFPWAAARAWWRVRRT